MKEEKEGVMQIPQYIFKSPYSSPVQFGQLDPNSVKKEDSQDKQLLEKSNETLAKAKVEAQSLTKEVQPTVKSTTALLDVYA